MLPRLLRHPATYLLAILPLAAFVLGDAQPPAPAPADAIKAMKVPEGFRVSVVAAEPMVRKPLTMSFDDRGRMWVIQYLQYPTPNGLKPIKVDQYLRTTYDRIPEPPPKGPKGRDRITILDDPDETGRFRKSKDFLSDLNLATGMCLGHGGVFVANPPYLLFYKMKDDAPVGDPEVLLEGFGMEDSHAMANSLQWGPDGWLYGAQGSTVTAKIRGIEFQQGIWRYHPLTKEFELFSEGGGNTWGLDFDRHGNAIAGTNWGAQVMLHQVQGGYYIKGFGKHGPLHNPYTFGYFDHVPYQGAKGGHVTCGGIIYRGGAFPEKFNDQYIAANLLSHALYWHQVTPQGSSFTARFGGDLLTTDDGWFRPVDLEVGPDGALYAADWCDKRANHVDPVDNWDRTKGRIYKLEWANGVASAPRGPKLPLNKLSSKELVALLSHPNQWYVRSARQLLAERRDVAVIPELRKLIADNTGQLALEALWALYVSDGFNSTIAESCLKHSNEDVRAWTVRLIGDAKKLSPTTRDLLVDIAGTDKSPVVRSQLACTAKRLPGKHGLFIVRQLLGRSEDVNDPHIPLLLWWAIEDKAVTDRDAVLGLLDSPAAWRAPLTSKFIVERLARRYMAAGSDTDLATCAKLLDAAPGPTEVDLLVTGMEKALEGRFLPKPPPALERHLTALRTKQPDKITLLRFALRLGSADAYDQTLRLITEAKTASADRVGLVEIVGQLGKPECVPSLLQLLADSKDGRLRQTVLAALQSFPDPRIATTVLDLYPKLPGDLRLRGQALLAGRPASALALVKAVEAGRIDKKEIAFDQLQRIAAFNKPELTKLVEKHWGKVGAASSGEKKSRMVSIAHILRQGKGNPVNGKALFTKHCATCHTLFGEGGKIGPELTGVDRKNLDFLLTSIVDPSAFIRPEFVAYTVETKDGRVLTGLIVEQSPKSVTLLDGKNERTVVAKENVEGEITPSSVSLMPEKILDPLDDQEIRDLLGYLRSDVK
jgi:putative membrane-bound dehydrogenase-like protein